MYTNLRDNLIIVRGDQYETDIKMDIRDNECIQLPTGNAVNKLNLAHIFYSTLRSRST